LDLDLYGLINAVITDHVFTFYLAKLILDSAFRVAFLMLYSELLSKE
jgi:hypothetical protein